MYNKSSLSQINTLSLSATKADSVPPYEQDGAGIDVEPEKQVFVLTGSQLQQIIESAIDKATEPHKQEIERLWQGYDRLAKDAAFNSQRVKKLEYKEPQPKQRDRSEILRALIAAYGGKMPERIARKKMDLSKALFSQLLASMADYIDVEPLHNDKRQNLLVLK